jgi:hypothetical protein
MAMALSRQQIVLAAEPMVSWVVSQWAQVESVSHSKPKALAQLRVLCSSGDAGHQPAGSSNMGSAQSSKSSFPFLQSTA